MKYFFILGNNPTLSLTEIASVLNLKPNQVLFLSEDSLVVDVADSFDAEKLINKLGGTIKIADCKSQIADLTAEKIIELFELNNGHQKINFGFSYYGAGKFDEKSLAMELKRKLKEDGVNSRWVTSKEKQLSSVVVEQNKLTSDKGVEIIIIKNRDNYYIGKTLVVQPFKELSKRDYGRPSRDDYSGMLPPKLAKIMINLASDNIKHKLLDPFCGSGTVLTESLLMGYKNITGADKSAKAVDDTKKNVSWLRENYQLPNANVNIMQWDVRNLSQKIKQNSIDVIVAEAYLGPSRMKENEKELRFVVRELESLYEQAFKQFAKILRTKGRVVIVLPVFKFSQATVFLSSKYINDDFNIINPLKDFPKNSVFKLTNRSTIVYGRPSQKIWREIFILEKK